MRYLIVILSLLITIYCKSNEYTTTIFGSNLNYTGSIIKVYKTIDYITNTKELIAIDTVDKQGNFKLQFKQSKTLLINIPLGIYNTVLFTEPNKIYKVILPPYQPKTKADILNPFYKPVEMYLGIKNADSLNINYQIANFNGLYHQYIDKNTDLIFKRKNKTEVDSIIKKIESYYTKDTNDFFKNYRKYSYAFLKYTSYLKDYRYVVREYYYNQPFLYQNPAYMDLFNQIFTNYLSMYMETREGNRIYSDIAYAKSPMYAKETFANNMVLLNDTLSELVLMKGIYDAFNYKTFPIKSLIITLDSISCCSNIKYHKIISKNIKTKVLKARQGFDAPRFKLTNINDSVITSDSLFKKFVYLNFISIESFTCMQDFELLKKLYKEHNNDFNIVSISIDDNFEETKKYFFEKGYNWTLLNYKNQKSVIDEYKVKAYPSYYLINPYGKLSLSPAVSPGENFEWFFFKIKKQYDKLHQLK